MSGKAETSIAPEGTIFVRGELWKPRSKTSIATGESVRVTGMDGLTLDVETAKQGTAMPEETSKVDA